MPNKVKRVRGLPTQPSSVSHDRGYTFTSTGSLYSSEAPSRKGLMPEHLEQAIEWIEAIKKNIADYFKDGPGIDPDFGKVRLEELTSYAEALRRKRDAP